MKASRNSSNKEKFQVQSRRSFLKQAAISTGALSSLVSYDLLAKNYSTASLHQASKSFSNLAPDFVYLNSGTEGSMPASIVEYHYEGMKKWASDPTTSYESDKQFGKYQQAQRTKFAKLFSVQKNNISLTDNTTMGLNMVLLGLNFKHTDKVIVTNQEHTAIMSPLAVQQEKTGLTITKRCFPSSEQLRDMDAEQVIDALFPNIDLLKNATALCVSHIYPSTGIRLPLKMLRARADLLNIKYLIVDGAQAFGMINIYDGDDDIKYTDFYACPGHKWLNGPPSTGILYLKNSAIKPPEFYPILSQRMEKYLPSKQGAKSDFPMAEALQVRGCSNTVGFSTMLAAIHFQNELGGAKAIEQHIIGMSKQVKDFLYQQAPTALVSPFNDERLASGLTVFYPFNPNDPKKFYTDKKTADLIVQLLLEKNIQIRSIGFSDGEAHTNKVYALRVSTAIFNTQQHLLIFQSALLDALEHVG